ncbi:hypothetical protein FB45DRAFT_435425 [Roridomyces roridus]|uniref:Uncharacterized protein n=1 Tax=Roridomyces roridus TaxID=1738132 RepID=A0AAD7B0M0_9AGAR|nr:hypothetical protein FB45DRAFT_435425 [Roridomyces roridus]
MLIKLTPLASPTPTPTILFALAFPDLPQSLPVPTAWAAQLARLSADDLEAPPSLHALDRAAAFPSLLQEVLFDLPARRICCTFLDGAAEDWELDVRCAEMLERVIGDVEESGKAEERAREWQRAFEAERMRVRKEAEAEVERAAQEREAAEREREVEMDRRYSAAKGKAKEQSLNSPPPSIKAGKAKGGLYRSRSLLHALVSTFSTTAPSSLPAAPASAPPTRSSFSTPRSPSPFRAFARRASFSALSTAARTDKTTSPESRPVSPPVTQNLESPAPSASSSTFATHQQRQGTLPNMPSPNAPTESPRLLRRRARSTLVDAFRAHVLPVLTARVGLFERASFAPIAEVQIAKPEPGGGYHAWVARSMLRRAEARMRELEATWPALARACARRNHADDSDQSPNSASASGFSPTSPFFGTPSPSPSPRQATFEPWSSSSEDSDSEDDQGADGDSDEYGFSVGSEEEEESLATASDGSSVHTPESGHSISYTPRHVSETSGSTTSSYFTCSDDAEAGETAAESKPASHVRSSTTVSTAAQRLAKREQREAKRARRTARAEHAAFARMTTRLRGLITQGSATRGLARMQREEGDRVREVRGVRRSWLDGKAARTNTVQVRAFRPSGLGRGAWGPEDVNYVEEEEQQESGGYHQREASESPPAYEDVMALGFPPHNPIRVGGHRVHRRRSMRMLAHLDQLELDVDVELEHLDAATGLEGLDIDAVGLEHHLDVGESIDVDAMGLDIDVDDVFGGGKARSGWAPRVAVPVSVKARRDVWEQRLVAAV